MGKNNFEMIAYTGSVISHPFWESFVIDVSGIRTPSGKMPSLREHDRLKPVGVITSTTKNNGNLQAQGYFLNTPDGRELRALLSEGFPLQASIGVNFEKVEKVSKDEVVSVNGQSFKGPGVAIRQSYVREISMVTLGADSETSVVNNLQFKRNSKMELVKDKYEDFGAALGAVMAEGQLGVDEAIAETIKRFPELYQEYENEILTGDENWPDVETV